MRITPVPENQVNPLQRALYDAFAERIRDNYGEFNAMREDASETI